ncbi:phage tail tape measure protein [Billgrantia gudaonensis]|uniref:Phage tail tape measure protein, TP901 family, core region n=1 Tax=Billgrantia gudaonensis TaxID=376427 RepID=A0A1G9DUM3_9GAMM|nr:phage tail tape measure protein [Halomonas gudaonensis]SDK67540.1 phage tail tape measure protein, TP901 family, core region [Halomonas gudaonensis]
MARDLKLQVILDAVDRATRPLKQISQGSSRTAEALKASREQLKTLERAQRDLRGFRQLKEQSDKTSRALGEQQGKIRALSRQMQNAEGDTASLARQRERAIRQARQLKDRYQQEQRKLHDLRRGMTQVDGVTGRYSDQQRELTRRIREANGQLEAQQRQLRKTAQKQRRAADAARRYHRDTGRAARMAGAGAAGMATGSTALYAGARMLAPGVAYGEQMSAVQAVGRFNADDEHFQALKAQSRDLGASTAFSATEVGAGQEFLLRAGMSAEAIRRSMRDVLDLAIANNTELGQTADIASNIAGAFKIDLEQEGAMGRVADILSGTASRANVDLQKLGDTMKYLGGAEDLELTMEQAASMAGLLGNIGIQGSQAGTTLRAMMNRLTNPADKGAAAIESIGLEIADAQGNMRALPEILRDINTATAELGNVERKAILQDIFGAEAGSGMAELVDAMGEGQLDEIVQALGENYGENARMARTMADNIGGDLKALNSAWQEVGITLTDTNEGPLRELIQNVTAITRAVGDWMKENPELTAQLATAAAGIAALVAVGGALTLSLASILGPIAMVRYGLSMIGIMGGGTGGKLLSLAKKAIPAVGQALVWLGRLAMGHPILALISLVAAGALYLWQNWETIGPKFAALWDDMKTWPSQAWAAIEAAFDEGIGGITRLLLDWSPLGLLWRGIRTALELLGVEIPKGFTSLGTFIVDGLIGGIDAKWQALKDKIGSMASGVTGWFKEKLGIASPSKVFEDFGGNLLEGLVNGIDEKWNALKDAIGGTADAVTNWFKDKLGINSPSRVFAELGGHTMDGYRQGLQRREAGPLRQIGEFGNRLKRAGAGLAIGAATLPAAADVPIDNRPPLQAAGGGDVNITIGDINVHPSPGMDEQALARYVAAEVQRALAEAERDAAARRRSALYDTD